MTTYSYGAAIAAIVDHDVARWGETERAASERLRRLQYPSIGLALNALAHLDPAHIDHSLAAEAERLFTAADRRVLRSGG